MSLRSDENRKEVIVNTALDGSPAKKAGLRPDDVLLEIGGVKVADLPSAVGTVRQAKPGSQLMFRVRRDGEEREVKVDVGLFPFTILIGLE